MDQTGAVRDREGFAAKPLPTALLRHVSGESWQLTLTFNSGRPLSLPSFDLPHFETLLGARIQDVAVAILADCVFGLAESAWPFRQGGSAALWKLIRSTKEQTPPYGRATSERFFADILARAPRTTKAAASPLPRRLCEELANANSVFQSRPYQKNIQTGTYRIWRDLSLNPEKWLNIWPFETPETAVDDAPWVFESFPSLFWKTILGQNVRKPAMLSDLCGKYFPEVTFSPKDRKTALAYPDWSDAAVLALSGLWLQKTGKLTDEAPQAPGPRLSKEGWIAGLEIPQDLFNNRKG